MYRKERTLLAAAFSAAALCSTVGCGREIKPDAHAPETGVAASVPASAAAATTATAAESAALPIPVNEPQAVPALRRMTGNTKSPSYNR
jgi:hypothetical protein